MELNEFQGIITEDNVSDKNIENSGIYRAKVVENKDPDKKGRVKVFIPVLMLGHVDEKKGLWAYPCPNEGGSSNLTAEEVGVDDYGSLHIPPKDSYVYVFFEDRDINKPRYFGGVILDDSIPTELTQGENWHKKHMIFKTPTGRMIFVSDDPDDASIIMRGIDPKKKKRSAVADPRRPDSAEIMLYESKDEQHALIKMDHSNYVLIDKKNKKIRLQHESGSFIEINKDITIQAAGKVYLNCKSATVEKTK